MQDKSPLEENASVSRQATPLQDLSTALTRTEAAFKMFRDFSVCGLRELVDVSLQGLTDSRKLGAMDLYNRSTGEVEALLTNRDIQHSIRTLNKACSPENLRNTAWTINPSEGVTLLVHGGRVVGVQKGIQRPPETNNPHQ
jgi:hypothetical protein